MSEKKKQEIVYGVHPLQQALARGKRQCYKIVLEKGNPPTRLASPLATAKTQGARVESLAPEVFRKKYGKFNHQGIVGYFSPIQTLELDALIEEAFQSGPHPALVLADEIQDPQNLGALIPFGVGAGCAGTGVTEAPVVTAQRNSREMLRRSNGIASRRMRFQPEAGGGYLKGKRLLDCGSGYGGRPPLS